MLDSLMLSDSVRLSLEEATARYAASVDQAAEYLVARGISHEAALDFRLGRVVDPVSGHDRFRGMLSIPYLSVGGVTAIKFRCLEDHDHRAHGGGKYDGPSQKARLFNSRACSTGGDLAIITEGELDAVVAQSVLGVPAVGTPGTTWMKHWPRILSDFDRVIVVADHDAKEDGSDPGVKHADKVRRSIVGSEVVVPPEGYDLTEWVLAEGADRVKEVMGL